MRLSQLASTTWASSSSCALSPATLCRSWPTSETTMLATDWAPKTPPWGLFSSSENSSTPSISTSVVRSTVIVRLVVSPSDQLSVPLAATKSSEAKALSATVAQSTDTAPIADPLRTTSSSTEPSSSSTFTASLANSSSATSVAPVSLSMMATSTSPFAPLMVPPTALSRLTVNSSLPSLSVSSRMDTITSNGPASLAEKFSVPVVEVKSSPARAVPASV